MDKRLSSPSNPSGAAPSLPSSEPSSSRNPQQSSQRPSSSSSSSSTRNSGGDANNNNRRLSMQTQQQRRASNIPRPAPIPIPEPISVGNPDSMTSSGEGPSSTSTTNSALAGVSAELIQHISTGLHSHSSSISPTSPKETNNLLGDGSDTPRSHSSPRGASTLPRPRSAVETTSSNTLPGGNGFGIQYDAINNRPHSSADAWGVRPPSVYSASNDGTHLGPNSRSQSPSADSMLRVSSVPRSRSSNFINTPSPLNPNALPLPRRPGSTMSRPPSMVLYRLAGIGDDFNPQMSSLSPPVTTNSRRASRFSTLSSANSSVFGDSKYPVPAGEDGMLTPPPSGAFLAYEYDPSLDLELPDDAEDVLHNPDPPDKKEPVGSFTFRGLCNILMVVLIPLILITLFVLYPVISYFDSNARSSFVAGTDHGTNPQGGNSPTVSTTRGPDDLIDPDTPDSAKTWSSSVNGDAYKLVFSDEFKLEGRTFGTDQDPFWEAVDLHDAKNRDLNYYQPEQVTTQGGHLVITLEERTTNGLQYVSGMLQSWNKFCFTGGYVEVGVSLPGSSTVGGFNTQV
ncbi:hypothetical protein FRB91_011413 [Serendipita sp. 411]|nr:hypothetical protein FRB91_011413 [Serendipita sp. 411]